MKRTIAAICASLCSVTGTLFTVFGCRTPATSNVQEAPASTTMGSTAASGYAAFELAWRDYTAALPSLHPYELQPRCQPLFYPPKGEARGVAVFFHGFTACPMQFIPFAEAMAAKGYYVVIPLLPGQGRGPTPMQSKQPLTTHGKSVSYADYYGEFLPTDAQDYAKFLDEVNRIMALAPGRHLAGGLSAGGALAIQASLQARTNGQGDLYDQVLSISPYLGMPGLYLGERPSTNLMEAVLHAVERPIGGAIYHLEHALATASEVLSPVGNIGLTFGDLCYASICGDRLPSCRQSFPSLIVNGGRDAICDFKISNIAALQRNGDAIREAYLDRLANGWGHTKHQIVAVSFDHSADVQLTVAMGEAIKKAAPQFGSYCLYDEYKGQKIGHVVFDLTEQPFKPMPWRRSFMEQATRFLDGGSFFDVDMVANQPRCHIYE